jgi:hypothetical protein
MCLPDSLAIGMGFSPLHQPVAPKNAITKPSPHRSASHVSTIHRLSNNSATASTTKTAIKMIVVKTVILAT